MKKLTLKRITIGLLQHLLAAGIMLAVASLLLNAFIAVESIDGTRVYRIFPTETGQEFEESEIYSDLFRNAVSDITQLVVIKGQLETNGVFDAGKYIDVTAYAAQIGVDSGCRVTAVYEADDLIKWGKHGVDYTDRIMSMSEFVNYFGYCIYPENFVLDDYGQLIFDGFYRVTEEMEVSIIASEEDPEDLSGIYHGGSSYGKTAEELMVIISHMEALTEAQLEDIVFSYIMAQDAGNIRLSREDDGRLMVTLPLITCRYNTVGGERQLVNMADNWVDYMNLQANLAASIETLSTNYERYQLCNPAYSESSSNVKYMVRLTTQEGVLTYTNMPELKEMKDEDVTEYFSEYRRHLIYYPDSLVFMGNTTLSEEEIDSYISLYEYAYPDTTHIWLGVDTSYAVETDAFYQAYQIYTQVVPNISRFFTLIAILTLCWLILGIHMAVTAGTAYDESGEILYYLNRFDHIWTEVFVLFGIGAIYGGVWGYRLLMEVAETAGVVPTEVLGIQLTRLYHYGAFVAYGVYVSMAACLFCYSLVRRIKCWNLWNDSFLHWTWNSLKRLATFVLRHRSVAINTMLPYNLFLFANLIGLFVAYQFKERTVLTVVVILGLILMDGIVGVLLFKRSAERNEIVDGIRRIRDGEVDFKLDTESLHGSSRELADAVNNIGEGIRKAVRTSMRDEQMKTDLITNVSHDIKTPLTSIINYVDLLKRLKIEEEPAKGYIDILDNKAQRLKQLTDDLVEASKISSGNIELEREKLNLTELINQSLGEFSEKLEEQKLQVIFSAGEEPAYIFADSRRMWRIAENIFNNICKYALEGTRVYIDLEKREEKIGVSFKNISKQQMNISPDELTERFIRGDSSRSTEGSGLGLSITKSLIQAQGGSFEIFLDGDLFKITMEFPEYRENL